MKVVINKSVEVLGLLTEKYEDTKAKIKLIRLPNQDIQILSGRLEAILDQLDIPGGGNTPGGGGTGGGGSGTGQVVADGKIIISGAINPITVNGTYYKTDFEVRNDAVYTNGTHAIVKNHDTTRGYSIVDLSGIYFLPDFRYEKDSLIPQLVRFNCMYVTQSQMLSTGTWSNENGQGTLSMKIQPGQIITGTVLYTRGQFIEPDLVYGGPAQSRYFRMIAYLTTPDKLGNEREYKAVINWQTDQEISMQYIEVYYPIDIKSYDGKWKLTYDTFYVNQDTYQQVPVTCCIAQSTATAKNPYDATYVIGDVYSLRSAIVALPDKIDQ